MTVNRGFGGASEFYEMRRQCKIIDAEIVVEPKDEPLRLNMESNKGERHG